MIDGESLELTGVECSFSVESRQLGVSSLFLWPEQKGRSKENSSAVCSLSMPVKSVAVGWIYSKVVDVCCFLILKNTECVCGCQLV